MRTFILGAVFVLVDPYLPLLPHETWGWKLIFGVFLIAGAFMAVVQDINEIRAKS